MLAVISFDRFLFIVRPHVHKRFMRPWIALTLVVGVWLLATLLSITPFWGLGMFGYLDIIGSCVLFWDNLVFAIYTVIFAIVVIGIITTTSLWTFCFARKFLRDHFESAGSASCI